MQRSVPNNSSSTEIHGMTRRSSQSSPKMQSTAEMLATVLSHRLSAVMDARHWASVWGSCARGQPMTAT